MRNHIMHGIDPPEIIGIQHILPARPMLGRHPQLVLQQLHHRIQRMEQLHPHPLAAGIQLAPQRLIHQAAQHRPGLGVNPLQHQVQLQA